MKKVVLSVFLSMFLAAGCSPAPSPQPNGQALPPNTSQTQEQEAAKVPVSPTPLNNPVKSQTMPAGVYTNPRMGFILSLPKGWVLPSATDDDPHFYANESCAKADRVTCEALEVQNHDEQAMQIESLFSQARAEGREPVKLGSLIPGATVIRSAAPGPAEGWKYEYDIFYPAQKKMFLVFTNSLSIETTVLSTLTLLQK